MKFRGGFDALTVIPVVMVTSSGENPLLVQREGLGHLTELPDSGGPCPFDPSLKERRAWSVVPGGGLREYQ